MAGTRRLDLDGLRGLSVLLVVGFHAGVAALRGAFVAVDVFFVLSGFFLATSLTRRLVTGEEIRPIELLARRIWRLLPVLVVVLLGTLATTLLYAPIDRAAVAQQMIPVSAFAGNLAFAADGVNYFRAGENPLLHTWTLGVELQLALLVPVLVMLFAAWGERRAGDATGQARRDRVVRTVMIGLLLAGIVSFTLAVIINETAPMWAYFGPHTRLWSFSAGALMAFLIGGGQSAVGGSPMRLALLQVAGLGLLLVPSLLYESTLAYPGVVALAPVGGTLLLLAGGGVAASALPGRVLASAPLAGLGRLSYAWYLWHWPLMVVGAVIDPGLGTAGKLAWGLTGLLAAFLTHRLLEWPGSVALMNRAIAGRPVLSAIGVSAALALLSMGAARVSARYVNQSVHSRYQAAREDHMGHGCWGGGGHDPASREKCAFGDVTSATTIALLGDSHASHWLGGLDDAGRTHGWMIDAHVMGACPVADLRGLIDGAAARMFERCGAFQEKTMQRLAASRPRAVLLSNADYYINPPAAWGAQAGLPLSVWTAALRRTYTRISQMGIEVIVMRGLPWVPFDVPSCLSRRAAKLPFARSCDFVPDRAFMASAQRAQDDAARGLPVRFIDMNDVVCGKRPGACSTERDGTILYTDDNHIAAGFSRSLSEPLGARLAVALGR